MWSQISCLSILVVLIGNVDALHPKNPHGIDVVSDDTEINVVSDDNEIDIVSDDTQAFEKSVPVGKGNTSGESDEYHRAAHVGRGECTKRLDPSVLFIGQAYSGSTSLSDQMQLHPELSRGDTKEHQYFKPDYKKIRSNEQFKTYQEGFWVSCNVTRSFDATMDYFNLPQGTKTSDGEKAVEYVKTRLGGNTKIIVMFRDPVDLIFHVQCSSRGSKLWQVINGERPFPLDHPPNVSIQIDRPYAMLSTWLKVFPKKKNWLFLSSDEYYANPNKVLQSVFKFVGVKPMALPDADLKAQSGRRRCNLKATAEERKAYWSIPDNFEDMRRIEKATGLKFYWHQKS